MLMQLRFMSLQNWNYPEVAALLLQYNADPDKPKNGGTTPLYAASERNHSEMVALLLEYKADPDKPWPE